jgi:ATP-dependent protease ClpP protease subunit
MNSTIFISGDIVPFTYGGEEGAYYDIKMLKNDLANIDKKDLTELVVDINTFGGDVTTGFAMANILRRYATENSVSIKTRISGYCSSIGTVIFLEGDKRVGNDYADFFVHNAWTFAVGDANEMKKKYDDLTETSNAIAKYYSEKTSIPFEEAIRLMNESTNIDTQTALDYGFFTEVENSVKAYNSISIRNLLIQNNSKLNFNKKQMVTKKESLFNKFITLLNGAKNLLVYTDTQDVLDFYDLEEGDTVKVGDKANFMEKKAEGDYKLADGVTTYTFVDGVLDSISEATEDDNTDELAQKDAKIAELEAKIAELESATNAKANEVEALNKKFNALKSLESEFRAELENEQKAPAQNNKMDFNEKIKNFKF